MMNEEIFGVAIAILFGSIKFAILLDDQRGQASRRVLAIKGKKSRKYIDFLIDKKRE